MKKFFKIMIICLLLMAFLTMTVSCGKSEDDAEYGFSMLEEKDNFDVSRREKLLTYHNTYKYLELDVKYYDEKGNTIKAEQIFIHNIFDISAGEIDLLIYKKVIDITGITYELYKKDRTEGYSYYHSYQEDETKEIEKYPGVLKTEDEFKAVLAEIFSIYYNPEILPDEVGDIEGVTKQTFSISTGKILTLELLFRGTYLGQPSVNEVRFNYSTDKVHNVKNYTTDGSRLIREVEYVYPGNFITDVKPIDESVFNKHIHIPAEPVRENVIQGDCVTNTTFESVVYCSDTQCGVELSRENITIQATGHTPGDICSICHLGAVARIGDVYFSSFLTAFESAKSGDEIVVFKDIDLGT